MTTPAEPVDQPERCVTHANAVPLLAEIRHALERLTKTGEGTVIDLLSVPMTGNDLSDLASALGSGEVEARLDALGPSLVRETAYPGVWWVEHFNAGQQTIARHIEVTPVPEILRADPRALEESAARLARQLDDLARSTDPAKTQPATSTIQGDSHGQAIHSR
ncbi:MAG: hydrogenase expression/formation protein [Gammaproteobacteria bacterium]|jgi:hydrogenase-1 operon protein HyaF|nr:hydrogenase expression/formation protein [Gammaproteobacteria bacterium]